MLLEAYVEDSGLLPKDTHRIRDRAELSLELRRILIQATRTGKVWACWAHNFRIWLFTAEMSLPLSRECGALVLQVNRYGESGELKDAES
jgi:hypothetical protein